MTPTTQFLRGQLAAWTDSWKRDHERAMACWELESRLRVSLVLYDLIADAAGRRGREIAGDFGAQREAYLREFHSLYRDWLDSSAGALSVLASLETEGYEVMGAERFKKAREEVREVVAFGVEGVITSLRSVKRGDGRPVEEVRDELRRRARG